jgi:hypothetical protein
VLGFLATIGLSLHEIRGIEQCGDLIKLGRSLEEEMRLGDGQFIREDTYYHKKEPRLRNFVNNLKGPVGAAWIIYPSVCLAWLFVVVFGTGVLRPAP